MHVGRTYGVFYSSSGSRSRPAADSSGPTFALTAALTSSGWYSDAVGASCVVTRVVEPAVAAVPAAATVPSALFCATTVGFVVYSALLAGLVACPTVFCASSPSFVDTAPDKWGIPNPPLYMVVVPMKVAVMSVGRAFVTGLVFVVTGGITPSVVWTQASDVHSAVTVCVSVCASVTVHTVTVV